MSAMAENLQNEIRENAAGPKQVTSDGVTVGQHSLKEQIEADRHLASVNATKSKSRGFVFGRFKPGGSQ